MNIIDKAVINSFHDMRIKQFGAGTSEALGWQSEHSQTARFAMLAGIGDMNGRSVLDIGCGHGDLSAYLRKRYTLLNYRGIDLLETFVAIAANNYVQIPATSFYLGDCYKADLVKADYVLASGSLSYHTAEADQIYKIITKLFNTCVIAFGFNLLSKIDTQGGILMTYEPESILQYCLTLTEKVILHNNYLEGDYTIWMYK